MIILILIDIHSNNHDYIDTNWYPAFYAVNDNRESQLLLDNSKKISILKKGNRDRKWKSIQTSAGDQKSMETS